MGYQQLLAARPQDLRGKHILAISTFDFATNALQQPLVESYKRVSFDPTSCEALADATRLQVINQQDLVNVSQSPYCFRCPNI